MSVSKMNLDHIKALSNGVFAITITLLARDIKPPQIGSLDAILSLWPSLAGYAVSYLFIAIVWINYHYALRFADRAAPRLIWTTFFHLFSVSLVPFSTTWVANTELEPVPVALYASIFFLVNATYFVLCSETLDLRRSEDVSPRTRTIMRTRSLITLGIFAAAALVSLKYPAVGMTLICICLTLYLRPEGPWRNI